MLQLMLVASGICRCPPHQALNRPVFPQLGQKTSPAFPSPLKSTGPCFSPDITTAFLSPCSNRWESLSFQAWLSASRPIENKVFDEFKPSGSERCHRGSASHPSELSLPFFPAVPRRECLLLPPRSPPRLFVFFSPLSGCRGLITCGLLITTRSSPPAP